jgi:hypothetical protein
MNKVVRPDRRLVEIGDGCEIGRPGVDGEAGTALETFVGPGVCKRHSTGEGKALGDVDLDAISQCDSRGHCKTCAGETRLRVRSHTAAAADSR